MSGPKLGQIIGVYQLEVELARGGMGTVYRGRHLETGTTAAIKVLKSELASRPEIIKRFLREGKIVAKLDHPNVVKVFDVGRSGELHYIVMQLVDGENLHRVINSKGPYQEKRGLEIALAVAEALQHAHENDVIHRDIKPSNLLLSKTGDIFLGDFGIARMLEQETTLTRAGSLLGTPSHMPPEQCRGVAIDHRSDIYSLGATLYTMLSGCAPFTGQTAAKVIAELLHQNPRPLETLNPNLSRRTVQLVKRMMAKHPAARPQTAREVTKEIRQLLRASETIVRLEPPALLPPSEPSHGFPVVAFLATLTAIALFGVAWLLSVDETERQSTVAIATTRTDSSSYGGEESSVPDGRKMSRTSTTKKTRPSRQALRSLLTKQVTALERAIVTGNPEGMGNFFDPAIRGNPKLLFNLGRVVRAVEELGADVATDHTLSVSEDKADVFYFFREPASGRTIQLPITWRLHTRQWYIEPQPNGSGTASVQEQFSP